MELQPNKKFKFWHCVLVLFFLVENFSKLKKKSFLYARKINSREVYYWKDEYII